VVAIVVEFALEVFVSQDDVIPHFDYTFSILQFRFDPALFFSDFLGVEDFLSHFAECLAPGFEDSVISTAFLKSLLVVNNVLDVEFSGVNVVELELERLVGVFSFGAFSSVEVEHNVQLVGLLDVSEEAHEVFEEFFKLGS